MPTTRRTGHCSSGKTVDRISWESNLEHNDELLAATRAKYYLVSYDVNGPTLTSHATYELPIMPSENLIDDIGRHNRLAPLNLEVRDLPYINIGFSTSGIDAAIARMHLKNVVRSGRKGFYVDIGCAHPQENSNTYIFYALGWSGICVDADAMATGYFKSVRPRDRVIHAGVSKEKSMQFYASHKKIRGMSEVKANATDFSADFGKPVPIECMPLTELFEKYVPDKTPIDLMSIDIEGAELAAFESNDWEKYRPKFIVVETHGLILNQLSEYPTVAYLSKVQYEPMAFFGGDVLMRDTTA